MVAVLKDLYFAHIMILQLKHVKNVFRDIV